MSDGLRDALEKLATVLWSDAANNGTDIRHPRVVLENRARDVERILAAHPVEPAGVSDEAVQKVHAAVVQEFKTYGVLTLADVRNALLAAGVFREPPTRERVEQAVREICLFRDVISGTDAVLNLLGGAKPDNGG